MTTTELEDLQADAGRRDEAREPGVEWIALLDEYDARWIYDEEPEP